MGNTPHKPTQNQDNQHCTQPYQQPTTLNPRRKNEENQVPRCNKGSPQEHMDSNQTLTWTPHEKHTYQQVHRYDYAQPRLRPEDARNRKQHQNSTTTLSYHPRHSHLGDHNPQTMDRQNETPQQ